MKRYLEKENYTHDDWTVERRRGHINSLLIADHADIIDGKEVLMLGSNTGTTLALLDERAKRPVHGLDINLEAVKAAWALLPDAEVEQGSALAIDVDDADFDTIIAFDFIEHIYPFDMPRLVAECHRVLRPGGHVLAFSPRTDPENPSQTAMDPTHVQWFTSARAFVDPWLPRLTCAPPDFIMVSVKPETRANPGDGNAHDGWVMLLRKP